MVGAELRVGSILTNVCVDNHAGDGSVADVLSVDDEP